MAALRKIPSREELQKLIDETEQIDLDEYTDRSAASLQAALRVAKAVVADANASKEELASAYNAVQTARDGLVKAENQQPQKGSSGSTSANASNAYGAAGVSVVTSCTERRYTGERAQRHDRGLHPAARPGILL